MHITGNFQLIYLTLCRKGSDTDHCPVWKLYHLTPRLILPLIQCSELDAASDKPLVKLFICQVNSLLNC